MIIQLCKYPCGFKNDFSTQHGLLVMIEKMKTAHDNNKNYVVVLTDLSNAFDCICHNLLIAELHAYGFDRNELKLIYDCLSGRSRKTKAGSLLSAYLDMTNGVPQGSILGLLLFHTGLCDWFLRTIALTLLMTPLLTTQ